MSTASMVFFAVIFPRPRHVLVLMDVMVHAVLERTLAKGPPEWYVRIIDHARPLKLFFGHVVNSCIDYLSCYGATIENAINSCKALSSCYGATLGTVLDSCNVNIGVPACSQATDISYMENSCNQDGACYAATDISNMKNSCNEQTACFEADGEGIELINCCNDSYQQCRGLTGTALLHPGCLSCVGTCIQHDCMEEKGPDHGDCVKKCQEEKCNLFK